MADSVSNKHPLLRRPNTAHVSSSSVPKPPLFPSTPAQTVSSASALSIQSLQKESNSSANITAHAMAMSHDEAKVFVKPRIFSAGPRSMISAVTGNNPSRFPSKKSACLEDTVGVLLSGSRVDVPLVASRESVTAVSDTAKTPLSRTDVPSNKSSFSTIANEATLFPRPKSAASSSPRPSHSAHNRSKRSHMNPSHMISTHPRSIVKATLSKWESFNLNKGQHRSQFQSSFYESTTAILSKALPMSTLNTPSIPASCSNLNTESSALEQVLKKPAGHALYQRNVSLSEPTLAGFTPTKKGSAKKQPGLLESSLAYKLTKAMQDRQGSYTARDYKNINPFLLQMNEMPLEKRESSRSIQLDSLEPVKKPAPPPMEKEPEPRISLIEMGKSSTFVPINLSERKVVEAKKCRLPISLQTDFSILRKYEKKGSKQWDKSYPFANPLHQFDKYKIRIQNSPNTALATSSDPFFARILEMERIEALTIESELREKRKPRLVKSSYKRASYFISLIDLIFKGVEAQDSVTEMNQKENKLAVEDDSEAEHAAPLNEKEDINKAPDSDKEPSIESTQDTETQELLKVVQEISQSPRRNSFSSTDSIHDKVSAEEQVPLAPSAENEFIRMIRDEQDLNEICRTSLERHRFLVLPHSRPHTPFGQRGRPPTPTARESDLVVLKSNLDVDLQDQPLVSLKPKKKQRARKSALKISRKNGAVGRSSKSKSKRSSALRPKSSKRKLLNEILPMVLQPHAQKPTLLAQRSMEISKIYLSNVDIPGPKPVKIAMRRSSKRMIKVVR